MSPSSSYRLWRRFERVYFVFAIVCTIALGAVSLRPLRIVPWYSPLISMAVFALLLPGIHGRMQRLAVVSAGENICPNCDSRGILDRAAEVGWYCPACDHRFLNDGREQIRSDRS